MLYGIVDVLVDIANHRGISPARVALALTLDRPAVASVLIGARTGEQLADNLGAADLSLTDEERVRLEVASRPPLLYPYWHQANAASDRLSRADRVLLDPYLAG
jgi:aryl-alcohol dehydrogenase-like predicted oxidoreductase